MVQVQPPQPQNCLISQEIRQFFFTFYPKKFPEKLCDFAKFAVDPNRDPDGSKIRPGGGVSASGSSCFLEEIFRSLQRRRQNLLHGPGRFLLGRRGDVGVGVQGEACREVSQHPGHRLDVHAVLKGQGGERVPEIVEPDLGQSGSFQYPVEHVQDAVWGDRAAGRRGEYPVAAADFFLLLL